MIWISLTMPTLPPLPDWVEGTLQASAEMRANPPTNYLWVEPYSDPRDERVFGQFAQKFTSKDGAAWLMRGLVASPLGGGPSVVKTLSVEPWPWPPFAHEHDITGTVLRDIDIGRMRDQALAELKALPVIAEVAKQLAERGVDVPTIEISPEAREAGSKATLRKRGRPSRPVSHYREVAELCLELAAAGARGIHREIANRSCVTESTVKDWIRRCRELGYLAPTKPGRHGFERGPNLPYAQEGGAG